MGWSWRSPEADPDLASVAGLERTFDSQADAEAWLTASYEELVDAGIDEVTLLEEDRVVYGPMSLHA